VTLDGLVLKPQDGSRAFGAAGRADLLNTYFENESIESVTSESAWRHTYRLLMWIDRTIGLAHCYESDKCQPGRPWYSRSLRFHHWLSEQLSTTPGELASEIDWLFTAAVKNLATANEIRALGLSQGAREQRALYEGEGMPLPGEDPELEALIVAAIESEYQTPTNPEFARHLSEQVHTYIKSENKRKNLVGEGFEDVLANLLARTDGIDSLFDVSVRPPLHELPGFNAPRGGEKTKKVDLALVRKSDGWRILVSCKWSVRSDREEQFATDFEAYTHLESSGESFAYVLLTNEFDPARLAAACENRRENSEIFTHVVHVNPLGVKRAYGASANGKGADRGGQERALQHMATGRLSSLRMWLDSLTPPE
jgi:hypothetical protein